MFIPREDFLDQISVQSFQVKRRTEAIVSLREIISICEITLMEEDYLKALLYNVRLAGSNTYPYRDCKIYLCRTDPNELILGQTFVLKSKLMSILTDVQKIFRSGFAKIPAYKVYGTISGKEGLYLAHYVPPIIEEHSGNKVSIDGTHRQFLTRGVGTTIETVVVRCPKTPLPFGLTEWGNIVPCDVKPEKTKRYVDLRPEYFRDLSSVGIDG